MNKRKIVFFTPLPPQRNGIADYSASFLPELADVFDIVLVVADAVPAPTPLGAARWIRLDEYLNHESEFADLQHIYQIGNNVDHGYMLPLMQRRPGFTTLHDLSVHHMMDTVVGDALGAAYRQIVTECHGVDGLAVTRDIAFRRARPEIFHLEIDFIALIARRSRAILTHSLTGQLRIAAAAPEASIYRAAHPYQVRAKAYQGRRSAARRAARAELNLPQDAVVLLSLGFVTRAKRIDLSLDALAWMTANGRRVVYVIAGAVEAGGFDLGAEIARRKLEKSVIVAEYVPDAQLLAYLAASDVLLNLRYPTMGETSGTITNALAIGCCAIVTAIGTFNEIPDHCVVKTPVAQMTPEGLLRRLLPLVDSATLRKYYEDNAVRFAQAQWSPEHFLSSYVEAIDDAFARAAPQPAPAPAGRSFKPVSSRRAVEGAALEAAAGAAAAAQMWWRSLMLPIGEDAGRLLVMGDAVTGAIAERAFGWEGRVETDAEAARGVAAVLLVEDAQALYRSPFEKLRTANRALDIGGLLVFNLTGATPETVEAQFGGLVSPRQLKPPSRPSALEELLSCAGFRVERILDRFEEVFYPAAAAGPSPAAALAAADARTEICVCAVKTTDALRFTSPLLFKGP